MSIAYRAGSASVTLEEELADLLHAAKLQDRQARAVAARLGWDGEGQRTLAAAAATEGYSRERVRQLEERVRDYARWAPAHLSATRRALRLLEDTAPIASVDVAAHLAAGGISRTRFAFSGLLTAAEMIGVVPVVYERDGIVLRHDQTDVAANTALLARRLVARNGAARLEELTLRLAGGARPGTIRRLLDVRPDVAWLDNRRSWFLIRGAASRATRTMRKMLSISRPLSIGEIDHGLRRSFRPVSLPLNVVRLVCEAQPWLKVDHAADTVTTGVPLDRELALSPLEQKLVAIFHQAGPTLTFARTVRLAEAAGLNPGSIGPYLIHTPIVKRIARDRYALCGSAG
jgi:hypothetical protein